MRSRLCSASVMTRTKMAAMKTQIPATIHVNRDKETSPRADSPTLPSPVYTFDRVAFFE